MRTAQQLVVRDQRLMCVAIIAAVAGVAFASAYFTTMAEWMLIAVAFLVIKTPPVAIVIACAIIALVNLAVWFYVACAIVKSVRQKYLSRPAAEEV